MQGKHRWSVVPLRRACACLPLLAVVLVIGCAGSGRQVMKRQMILPFTEEQRETLEQAEAAPYQLRRGDVFAVESLIDAELRQPGIIVLPDGTASLTHLGTLQVAGLSVVELEQQISAAYSREFRDVSVNVVLRQISGRRVYVLGEVKQPGLFDVGHEGMSVMGAIAMAGGFNDFSSQGSVVLLRLTPDGYLSREFNLAALRTGRVFDPAVFDLQSYDIIYVDRSKIGDFAMFTRTIIGSLTQYSRLALDMLIIDNPAIYRR